MSIVQPKNINKSLNLAINVLKNTSQSPELDAEILLSHALNKPKEYLYTYPEKPLTSAQIKKFRQLINRRKKYEPIAHIIGYKYFYGLKFKVNKHTLIPRPETELMVEEVLNAPFLKQGCSTLNNIFILRRSLSAEDCDVPHSRRSPLKRLQRGVKSIEQPCFLKGGKGDFTLLLDIGAGTGCIPIAIAKNLQNRSLKIFASDISARTLKIAKENAKMNKVDKKIKFLHGNLLEPWEKIIKNNADKNIVITANLPYLPASVYNKTPCDVKFYEPKSALYGGKDGLKYYRALFRQLKKSQPRKLHHSERDQRSAKNLKLITPAPQKFNIKILCEIDPSQKNSMPAMAKNYFPDAKVQIKKDLSGLERLTVISILN